MATKEGLSSDYKYGFVTEIETESFAKGLDEGVVRAISEKKGEPQFLLDFRLRAFAKWKQMKEPKWANVGYPPIDFQNISYYSAPKKKPELESLGRSIPSS